MRTLYEASGNPAMIRSNAPTVTRPFQAVLEVCMDWKVNATRCQALPERQ
jgi:hypothetical protein